MQDLFLSSKKLGDHPYTNYVSGCWNDEPETCLNNFELFVFSGCIMLPYRVWLIVRDIFVNSIKDLYTDQFEGKKMARLVYNLTSGIILDPIYLLAGTVIYVNNIGLFVANLCDSTKAAKWFARVDNRIEAIFSYPYAKLADALGLDEMKYYQS